MTQWKGLLTKYHWRAVVCYLPVAVFFLVCGQYLISHWSDFEFLSSVTLPELIVAGLLLLFGYIMTACQLKMFVAHFRITVGFCEVTSITGAMLLGNLVIPMRGGTAALAIYLRKVHALEWHAFATIYGGTALVAALVNSGLSLLGLVLLATRHGVFNAPLTACCIGLFCFLGYLTLSPPPVNDRKDGLLGVLSQTINAWHVLSRNRQLLLLQILIAFATAIATVGAFAMIYLALGLRYPFSAVLVSSSLGNLMNIIPLTPGSLGIFDAVVIEIPQMFGMDAARAIAGTLAFRVLSFLCALALGTPGTILLVRAGLAFNSRWG